MNIETEEIDNIKKSKKKLALIIASLITFLIFVLWIFLFSGSTKKEFSNNDKGFDIFSDLEHNVGERWNAITGVFKDIKGEFNEIEKNIASTTPDKPTENIATTTESIQKEDIGTTTEENL